MSGFSFDDLEDLDEGANAAPPQGGSAFDQLEDLDASDDGFQPFNGSFAPGSKGGFSGSIAAGDNSGTPWLKQAANVVGKIGEGAAAGVGVNLPEVADKLGVGQRYRDNSAIADFENPVLAPVARFGGEATGQTLLGLGPVAGGVLSGIGNTEGGLADKARGAAVGGVFGKIGGEITGKLSSLLGRGAAAADREAVSQGLMHSGATRADLKRLDKLGGREKFAEGADRLGLTGRPSAVEGAAENVVNNAEATRQGLQSQAGGLSVDPAALGAGIRGSNPYPGVTGIDDAVERAAMQTENLAPSQGQGAPWEAVNKHRQYWGDKTNFASGTPESSAQRGIHGAINDELGDALTLQNPGAGEAWRQAGRDEHVGLELGDIATAARDRARDRGLGLTDIAAGGVGALVSGGNPLGVLAGVAAKRGLQANQHLIGQGAAKLSSLAQRGAAGAMQMGTGAAAGELGAAAAKSLGQVALDALYSGGDELGQYKHQIADAAGSPNPGAVSDVITRLAMTDPQFRQNLLPLLSQRSSGGG